MPNFDDIAKIIIEKWELLAAIVAIGSGSIGGLWVWWQNRRKAQRLRQLPSGDFPFDVIKPYSPDVLKQIMGGDENNPLADYKIPYQERQPDRNIRQELEDAFAQKNWVLILGKSGLGKTREAAHLAKLLNEEGWTILKLADQEGEWLDVPKAFPSEIRPDVKLLFFLDDLNRWSEPGNPHEIHPRAGEELARPIREPVQERLERLLHYFETQCRAGYVRVIATARNEREPDTSRHIAPWDKLQWEKYKSFWQQFHCYLLVEPSEGAIVGLLTDGVAVAGLRGVPEEYEQIARRNDGTFRNITLNLDSAKSRGLAVNNQEFSPRLDQTWRRRYNKVVERYPLAVYAYDAVEVLRNLNLALTPPMLEVATKRLVPGRGRGLQKWWRERQLQRVLNYLVKTERVLKPQDGQIEAKKTGAVDVEHCLPAILEQLTKMAKQYPNYVAAECYACGNALHELERYEGAITSHDEALKLKSDAHQAWNNRGVALTALGHYEEAIASYDKALKIKPDKHEAWNNRGNALSALGCYKKAIASYDEAVKIKPDKQEYWFNRGLALSALERYEEAIANYNEAVRIRPDDYEAWNNRGLALSALKRYEEAIASYDEAVKIEPDGHEAWYNCGDALLDIGRYEEAIASYNKAVKIKLDDYGAWNNRGLALSALRRYDEAIVSYNEAVKIKLDDYEAWYNRSRALAATGRNEEAIASYDKVLNIKPDEREVWGNRGIALSAIGRNEEAIASYDKVLNIKPDDYKAWGNRGIALTALGRYEEAIVSYNKVLEIKPNDKYAIYKKAACYSLQGDVQNAVETLQQAILLNFECREWAKTDSDFDLIRQDDRFQALLNPD